MSVFLIVGEPGNLVGLGCFLVQGGNKGLDLGLTILDNFVAVMSYNLENLLPQRGLVEGMI